MKVCAIIPAYNNAPTIGDVILRCRQVIEPDIFVVSDGSTDDTPERARQAGSTVFEIDKNQGKGNAILHGLEKTKELGFTHAIVLDGDGQHLPEEIPQFIAASWDCPTRIWNGVRRMGKDSTPASSRRGRAISNFWATLISWQRCRDTQCGYRVYPIDETLSLGCQEKGFPFEMEVLIRASWSGIRIGHKQIDVIYPEPSKRISHFDMRRDNLKFSWLSFRMFWGMLARLPMLLYRRLISM